MSIELTLSHSMRRAKKHDPHTAIASTSASGTQTIAADHPQRGSAISTDSETEDAQPILPAFFK